MMENVEDRARTQGISVEDALSQRAEQTALKRIGEPKELAYLVAFWRPPAPATDRHDNAG